MFVGPSMLMMILFIAAPLGGVLWNSFHVTKPVYEDVEVESCTPGFLQQVCKTEIQSKPVLDERGNVHFEANNPLPPAHGLTIVVGE